jgi:heme-degrading monooxygenase HmoA
MVLESAEILVKPGMEEAFEVGVREAAPLFRRAQGCTGMRLQRGIENPLAYRLLVQWNTLEDHTVHFRGSADFQVWRTLVGHCFDGAPNVTHLAGVLDAF